jgi:hypothetical protein
MDTVSQLSPVGAVTTNPAAPVQKAAPGDLEAAMAVGVQSRRRLSSRDGRLLAVVLFLLSAAIGVSVGVTYKVTRDSFVQARKSNRLYTLLSTPSSSSSSSSTSSSDECTCCEPPSSCSALCTPTSGFSRRASYAPCECRAAHPDGAASEHSCMRPRVHGFSPPSRLHVLRLSITTDTVLLAPQRCHSCRPMRS